MEHHALSQEGDAQGGDEYGRAGDQREGRYAALEDFEVVDEA